MKGEPHSDKDEPPVSLKARRAPRAITPLLEPASAVRGAITLTKPAWFGEDQKGATGVKDTIAGCGGLHSFRHPAHRPARISSPPRFRPKRTVCKRLWGGV